MKPRDQVKRRIVGEWVRKATADLQVAQCLVSQEDHFANAVAFHCQQAAEKYLKAFLVWSEVDFPKTHDLKELLNLAEPVSRELAVGLKNVIVLTRHGVDLRYPGDRPDAALEEAREAVEMALQVRDAVLPLLPHGSPGQ